MQEIHKLINRLVSQNQPKSRSMFDANGSPHDLCTMNDFGRILLARGRHYFDLFGLLVAGNFKQICTFGLN